MFECPSSLIALASVLHVDLEHCRMCWASCSCAVLCCSFHVNHLLPFLPHAAWLKSELTEPISVVKNRDINKRVKNTEILKAAQIWCVFLSATLSFHSIPQKCIYQNIQACFAPDSFICARKKWPSGFRITAVYILLRYIPDLSRKQMSLHWLKLNCICSRYTAKPTTHKGRLPEAPLSSIPLRTDWCSLCHLWWAFPKVQAELNLSGHYHTAGGFPSWNTSMCQKEAF